MGLSCPRGISRFVPAKAKFFGVIFCHMINSLLTKLVRSRWLDIGLVLFFRFYSPRLRRIYIYIYIYIYYEGKDYTVYAKQRKKTQNKLSVFFITSFFFGKNVQITALKTYMESELVRYHGDLLTCQ